MGKRYKYEPLYNYLLNCGKDYLTLTYNDIETIIDDTLPPSAYNYPEFWYGGHSLDIQTKKAGYKIVKSDINMKYIELAKISTSITQEQQIKTISELELEKAAIAVSNDSIYGPETDLIKDCVLKFPYNTDKEIIALKIGLIDITNSTNISRYKKKISVVNLVDILAGINDFDTRLSNGDISLVEEISKKTKEKYNQNLFSFASKYCCYHNMYIYGCDDFPIYDAVLMEHIPEYINGITKTYINNLRESCDYKGYRDIIDEILCNNNITIPNKRRKFDNFIWYYNR